MGLLEIRDAGPFYALGGYASTWADAQAERGGVYFVNERREGTFLEVMGKDAFPDATSGVDRVELRREHQADGHVYAETPRTLGFRSDARGLKLAAALSKTDGPTRDLVNEVRSGEMGGLSVGMVVRDDHWGKAEDGRTALRTITRATLREVSVVKVPANPMTTLAVRHEVRGGDGVVEFRSYPLVFRQEPKLSIIDSSDDDEDAEECPVCDGLGFLDSGHKCLACAGTGHVLTTRMTTRTTMTGRPQMPMLATVTGPPLTSSTPPCTTSATPSATPSGWVTRTLLAARSRWRSTPATS